MPVGKCSEVMNVKEEEAGGGGLVGRGGRAGAGRRHGQRTPQVKIDSWPLHVPKSRQHQVVALL